MSDAPAAASGPTVRARYPSYRESEVWFGEIPSHWGVARTKHLARLESGHTPSRQRPEYWQDCKIPWFGLADVWQIRGGGKVYVYETKEKISELGLAGSSARLLPKGTVILSRTASVGFAAILGTEMATTQDFVNWICGPRLLPEYLLYVFRTMGPEFRRLTMGSTHQTIYMPHVASFMCPVPPIEEQERIVGFVRQATQRVDALIEKKSRLVALLEEKCAALRTQAVTKGLDSGVGLRESGTSWVGRIPRHWEVRRIKHVAKMESGHTPDKKVAAYWTDGDIPWVSLKDTRSLAASTYVAETAYHTTERGIKGSSARILPKGTVVFSRDATIGRCAIAARPMAVSQHFIAWVCGPRLVPEYLLLVFRSMTQELERLTMGATIRTIGMPDVKELVTPLPPVDEQKRIVAHVQDAFLRLRALSEGVQTGIEHLREYRTALAFAAVTGKIDVREEVA